MSYISQSYIEWTQLGNNNIDCNKVLVSYNSTNSSTANNTILGPNGSINPCYGFLQETRIPIANIISSVSSNVFPKSLVISFGTNFSSDFYQGLNYYAICTRERVFYPNIDYWLNAYIFYVSYSFSSCIPVYFINSNLYLNNITIDSNIYSVELILIYVHPVNMNVPPLEYTWTLYKVIVNVSLVFGNDPTSAQITLVYNALNPIVSEIFANTYQGILTNQLCTRAIVPEGIYHQFATNHLYCFGINNASNAAFPPNNSCPYRPNVTSGATGPTCL